MGVKINRKFLRCFLPAALLLAAIPPLQAQQTVAAATLPDAPTAVVAPPPVAQNALAQDQEPPQTQPSAGPHPPNPIPRPAPRLARYIQPDELAVSLTARDKLELSLWEQIQPYSFFTQILAAGYEQLLNSDPKYGSDSAGFGERLGAANLRQNSQAIFSDGVLPAILHQDPRYYRRGTGKFLHRVLYSATRVLVTRTDGGNETVNSSELIGYAGAAALTVTYYPAVSATWGNAATAYGVSLAGAAFGNEVHEFGPDLIRILRRRHRS